MEKDPQQYENISLVKIAKAIEREWRVSKNVLQAGTNTISFFKELVKYIVWYFFRRAGLENKLWRCHDTLKTAGFRFFSSSSKTTCKVEKNQLHKSILVINYIIPEWDKACGCRSLFDYLKLFSACGMDVWMLGDDFVRREPYASELEKIGVHCLCGDELKYNFASWIVCNGMNYDYIFLNRVEIARKYLRLLKKHSNAKILFYGHDLFSLREKRKFIVEGGIRAMAASLLYQRIESFVHDNSDVIYYPSQSEVAFIKSKYPRKIVRQIPVLLYDVETAPKNVSQVSPPLNIVFVGSFGHSPNVDGIAWFVEKVFPVVATVVTGVKLYIVGSNPPESVKKFACDEIIITGYITDKELAKYYREAKVAIVPLRYGAGVKGKVIEALFWNVPVVSTSIGVEGMPDVHEVIAVADDEISFSDAVIRALKNYNSKKNTDARREYIIRNYSAGTARDILKQDIDAIC